MDDFNEYIRQGEPNKAERVKTWQTAIGLQKVDNLEVSEYLVDTARKHIEGDIKLSEVRALVDSYYEKKSPRTLKRMTVILQSRGYLARKGGRKLGFWEVLI